MNDHPQPLDQSTEPPVATLKHREAGAKEGASEASGTDSWRRSPRERARRATMSVAALVLLVALVVGGSIHFGFFSRVDITVKDAGAVTILALETGGGMRKTRLMRKRLSAAIEALGVQENKGYYCAIHRQSGTTIAEERRSDMAGYSVTGELPKDVEPLTRLDLPVRRVVSATVRTHPRLAFAKAYPSVIRYLTKQDLVVVGPVIEFRRDAGIVELQVPVTQRKARQSEDSQ